MNSKILIVYFSHSAHTRKLARLIQKCTDGVLFELIPQNAYPANYNAVVAQSKKEVEKGYHPLLKAMPENIEIYHKIFVGTPNWFGTMAPPVASFLAHADLSGKILVPFCTNGGGGLAHIGTDMKRMCPHAKVLDGFAATENNGNQEDVSHWLKMIGIEDK